MCATIEIIIKKSNVTEEDEKRIKKIVNNRLNFDADIITVRILEEKTKKQIERLQKWEKENPEEYRAFRMAYDSVKAFETFQESFTKEDKDYLLIHTSSRADTCLCDTTSEDMKYVLDILLQEAEELYYDASSERYHTQLNPFWKPTKTVKLSDESYSWKPSMGFKERVNVIL